MIYRVVMKSSHRPSIFCDHNSLRTHNPMDVFLEDYALMYGSTVAIMPLIQWTFLFEVYKVMYAIESRVVLEGCVSWPTGCYYYCNNPGVSLQNLLGQL